MIRHNLVDNDMHYETHLVYFYNLSKLITNDNYFIIITVNITINIYTMHTYPYYI